MILIRLTIRMLRIMGPDEASDEENQKVYDSLDFSRMEDAMNDQLPDGYYAKIDD